MTRGEPIDSEAAPGAFTAEEVPTGRDPCVECGDPTYPEILPGPDQSTDREPWCEWGDVTYPDVFQDEERPARDPQATLVESDWSDTSHDRTLPSAMVFRCVVERGALKPPELPKDLTPPPHYPRTSTTLGPVTREAKAARHEALPDAEPHSPVGDSAGREEPPKARASTGARAKPRPSDLRAATSHPAQPRPTRARFWLLRCVAGGLLALLLVLAWKAGELLGDAHRERSLSLSSASPMVSLSIVTTPENAQVLVDGRPFPNSRMVMRPADGLMHELRVRAPGYRTLARSFRLDRNLAMVFGLSKDEADAPPARADRAAPRGLPHALPTSEVREAPARSGKGRCAPPFVVDEQGVKIYRVECL